MTPRPNYQPSQEAKAYVEAVLERLRRRDVQTAPPRALSRRASTGALPPA